MSVIGATKKILDQHGGGLNLLLDDTTLADNEWRIQDNFDVLGNRMVANMGYERFYTAGNTNTPIQGIKTWENFLIVVQNNKLFIYDSKNKIEYPNVLGVPTGGFDFTNTTGENFNIIIGKFLNTMFIVLCEQDGKQIVKLVEFNTITHTFTNGTFTNTATLPNPSNAYSGKATCGIFYESRLLLGGDPENPSLLSYSKKFNVTAQNGSGNFAGGSIYDFTGYSGSTQIVGDISPIVGFNIGVNRLYVAKRNSIWQISGTEDHPELTSPTFAFKIDPITSTGPLNQEVFRSVLQDTFYFDGNTVRRLSYEEATFNLKDTGISENIQVLLDKVPLEQSNATSFFCYPYYCLFLRNELSSVNNVGFIYNVINNTWRTQSGMTILHATNGYMDKSTAYFGDVFNGQVYEYNSSYTYDGGKIQRYALSKNFDFGERVGYKRIYQTEVAGNIQKGMKVYVDIIIDDTVVDTRLIGETPNNLELPSTTGSTTLGVANTGAFDFNEADVVEYDERYEHFYDGRTYAIAIRTEDIGVFELHTRSVTYKKLKNGNYDIHY